VVDSYRRKRDHFADVLTREFHGIAHWQVPAGGLFFWLHLDTLLDTRLLLRVALAHGVAFMPGEPFFAQPPEACGQLRLNFTHASAADVERGLAILAGLVREYRA
jgi:DNA-binding transcriptional MocR family regulator